MTHVPNIIPALLVHGKEEALQAWNSILDAELVQIDCLDGNFVPNQSYYDAEFWPTGGPGVELHIMAQFPLGVMQAWRSHPLLRRVIWHIEAPASHFELISWCRNAGVECGIALNPETPLERIEPLNKDIDLLLLMSVKPGWSGQPFIPTTLEKLKTASARYPHLSIGIDGGVSEELLPVLAELGATDLYLGSRIFKNERTPNEVLRALEKMVEIR